MRLLAMKHTINNNAPPETVTEEFQKGNSSYVKINNWSEIGRILNSLNELEALNEEIQAIYLLGDHFQSFRPTLVLDRSDYFNRFLPAYTTFRNAYCGISKFANSYIKDDDDNQINIKIPCNLSFVEISKIIGNLDFIFNKCGIIREANGNNDAIISNVDNGSIILSILLESAAAFMLIGKIATVCYDICNKHLALKNAAISYRIHDKFAQVLDGLAHMATTLIKNDCIAEAQKIIEDNDKEALGDSENSLSMAMEKITTLYFAGVEIHGPLVASPEQITSFPNFSQNKGVLKIDGAATALLNAEASEGENDI